MVRSLTAKHEGCGFDPWPGRGLKFGRSSFATPSADRGFSFTKKLVYLLTILYVCLRMLCFKVKVLVTYIVIYAKGLSLSE